MNFGGLNVDMYAINTNALVFGVFVVLFLIVFILIMYFVVKLFLFNVKIISFEKVGERGQRSRTYTGRHIVKNGNEFLKISGKNDLFPWPDSEYITNNKGIIYKSLVHYYKTSEAPEDWKPVSVDLVEGAVKLEAHDSEVRLWSSVRAREKVEKYDTKNFFEKYGAYIGLGAVCVVLIITVIMTMDALKTTTQSIGNAQQAVSEDLKILTQMQERLKYNIEATEKAETVPPGG